MLHSSSHRLDQEACHLLHFFYHQVRTRRGEGVKGEGSGGLMVASYQEGGGAWQGGGGRSEASASVEYGVWTNLPPMSLSRSLCTCVASRSLNHIHGHPCFPPM